MTTKKKVLTPSVIVTNPPKKSGDPVLSTAKIEYKRAKLDRDVTLLKELINNPAVEIVGAVLAIEYAQRQKWCGEIAGSVAEAGVIAAVGLKHLAPILPTIAEAGGDIMKTAGTIAPMLAAL